MHCTVEWVNWMDLYPADTKHCVQLQHLLNVVFIIF